MQIYACAYTLRSMSFVVVVCAYIITQIVRHLHDICKPLVAGVSVLSPGRRAPSTCSVQHDDNRTKDREIRPSALSRRRRRRLNRNAAIVDVGYYIGT